jgi:acetyl esterase/lipase
MTLRYGAVLSSLQSLRGAPGVAIVTPTHADVRYRDGLQPRGTIAPLADLYVPRAPNGASVVLVHGGGFVLGSRRMKPMRYLTAKLVEAGIAVCAINYRMIFRGGRLDEATSDVVDAFEFWAARTSTLDLDPARISLVGLSAGATLSLLAAAQLDDGKLVSLACAFGLYDAEHLRGPAQLLPRLLLKTADRSGWNARFPRHARQPAAPTLLLHGTDDGLVPVDQAHKLAAHRDALGLPTRLVIYDGAPHGFFNLPVPEAAAGAREIIDHVTRRAS